MPQSLSNIIVHATFSTKDRQPLLTPDLRSDCFSYLAATLGKLGSPAVIVGGHSDHIHTLFRLGRTESVANLLGKVKASSSNWLKRKSPGLREFSWQAGYAAFSVSQSDVDDVVRYIQRQEEHHRLLSFQDELRAALRENGLELDERYYWD